VKKHKKQHGQTLASPPHLLFQVHSPKNLRDHSLAAFSGKEKKINPQERFIVKKKLISENRLVFTVTTAQHCMPYRLSVGAGLLQPFFGW